MVFVAKASQRALEAGDPATVSNFREVLTKHIHLDIDVGFADKAITGLVKVTLEATADNVQSVLLDTHEAVEVKKVTFSKDASEEEVDATFKIEPFAKFGQSLVVNLPAARSKGDKFDVTVEFVTRGDTSAVCWLDPEQTADKQHPLMYTQGQAVCNRSFFPSQDTPMVKSTYSALVHVPGHADFTALMSAPHHSRGNRPNRNGVTDCFFFEQDIPVQVYLVALAVGDFVSAEVGPRSHVWSERSVLAKAQSEFSGDVEQFLSAGEQLFGGYVWTRYDILIMPPSFPFGGMENPCLTFVTPCIVVGDKSLIDVVIHEISHSWFGNLVTNANWSEFWLNEGFTMYAQRRIQAKTHGEEFTALETFTGQSLLDVMYDLEGTDSPLARLRVVIEKGVDPDDTYNETPYEKGFCFVSYLASLVGDVRVFDDFLKEYVDNFKFQSIVAEDLFEFFFTKFPQLKEAGVEDKPGLEFHKTWLHTSGRPPYVPDLSAKDALTSEADKAAEVMCSGRRKGSEAPSMSGWQTYQTMYFLDIVSKSSPLPDGCMAKLATTYPSLATTNNAELLQRWCEIVIKNDAKDHFDNVRHFLTIQGKQKYTKPLYKLMSVGTDQVRHLAAEVFRSTQATLHVTVRDYVRDILTNAGILV